MILLKSVYILMPAAIVMAFIWAPPAEILGDYSRIIYFHVPLAWVSVLAFAISGMASILYLVDDKKRFEFLEEKAFNSAVIGIFFCVLSVITGSIWAKLSWGSYWNWDPRETSIVVLLIIYVAYFSLRSSLSRNPVKGKVVSSYLIFAMLTVPFFIFIVPRVYPSLHPDPIINADKKMHLDSSMKITLLVSISAFTILYFYILSIMNRIAFMNKRIEDVYNEG